MVKYSDFIEKISSQQPAIKLLENMGYKYMSPFEAFEQRGDYRNVVLKDDLREFLQRQRFEYDGKESAFSQANINNAIKDVDVSLNNGLAQASQDVYDMLLYGKSYNEILADGSIKSFNLKYVDWENINNNIFRVVDEFTVSNIDTRENKRPDIVVFVNGLPWVVIECKRSSVDVGMGVRQNYENFSVIPQLFKLAQIVLALNPNEVKYGTCGTGREYFVNWKEEFDGWLEEKCKEYVVDRSVREQDRVLISLLSKERLFLIVKNYILYDYGIKKIARYQQFFACEKTIKKVKSGKGGFIWHTQGSGKSLTMVMLVKRIKEESIKNDCFFKNPRFLMVCDRLELDEQLMNNFAKTGMRPNRATTGNNLVSLIKDEGKTIITTVIHKFETAQSKLQPINGKNIFIFVDECHRTQSGNFHNYMRDILPNAIKIGFTGTPIFKKEKKQTHRIFGDLIDSYTILEAEKDKVIVPLNYEGRIIPQKIADDNTINKCFEQICFNVSDEEKEKLKTKWSSLTKIMQVDSRLQIIAFAIAKHFASFKNEMVKAMVTESSRVNAIKLHRFLRDNGIRSKVVISPNTLKAEGIEEASDYDLKYIEDFFKEEVERDFGKNYEKYERYVRSNFIDSEGCVDVIVAKDKLLTGFDAPIAKILYIDKPLRDHNLLQAIARVNRIYTGKEYGQIIDFYGVFGNLKSAIDIYSNAEYGLGKFDENDIKGTLLIKDDLIRELRLNYENLISIFSDFDIHDKNVDIEVLEDYLKDSSEDKEIGKISDKRKDFYDKLNKFSLSLECVLRNYEAYKSLEEEEIKKYKEDLKFFQALKSSIKIRYGDDSKIDFSLEDKQIKRLLNSYLSSEMDKIIVNNFKITDKEAMERELAKMSGNKSKADAIATRMDALIKEEFFKDPLLYKNFTDKIKETIEEYENERRDEDYFLAMQKIAEDYREGFTGNKYPENIENDANSKSFYGCLKISIDEKRNIIENSEFDLELGNLSIKIKELYKDKIKPNWENNMVIRQSINREIDKFLFKLMDDFHIDLSDDDLDKIEENIFKTAVKRYEYKLI